MKSLKHLFKLLKNQSGGILVYFAIGLVPIVGAAGLVMDYGNAAAARSKMQKAADAGALAGAGTLPWDGTVNVYQDPEAIARDVIEANYSKYDSYSVDVSNPTVTVEMQRDVPTFFMRVFGRTSIDVGVRAVAQRGTTMGKNTGNIMPFAIINPNTNNDPSDDLYEWNFGREYILAYDSPNIMVQDWANGDDPPPENPGNGNGNGGGGNSMGWRSALRFNSNGGFGGGANDFRETFKNGWPGTAEINDVLPVKTGNIAGPIEQGRETRLSGEGGLTFNGYDTDKGFVHNRVILVPIVSLLVDGSTSQRFTIDMFYAGEKWEHNDVILDGFAAFWLLTEDEQGDVDGNGNLNDGDWIVGKFLWKVRVPTGSEGGGSPDDYYGLITPARLID